MAAAEKLVNDLQGAVIEQTRLEGELERARQQQARASLNGGLPDTQILFGTDYPYVSADIAANGTGVWVVWVDDRDGGSFDVWSNRSSDSPLRASARL